jgi:uncharacterized membrane protein YdbT with pleckstrin-like domain
MTMTETETLIWEGHPSQWTNFGWFLACILIVPIPFALWRWIETRCFVYRITSERIAIRQGVFSKRTDELELYRVKDTALVEPFWLRMVSLGHLDLTTSDRTTPFIRIAAVPEPARIREELRRAVEHMRAARGVREADIGDVVGGGPL